MIHQMYKNESAGTIFEGLRAKYPTTTILNGDRSAGTWYHAILTKTDYKDGHIPVTILADRGEVFSEVAELYAIMP